MHHDRAVESEESGFAPDPLWAVWQINAPQTMQMKDWQPYGSIKDVLFGPHRQHFCGEQMALTIGNNCYFAG